MADIVNIGRDSGKSLERRLSEKLSELLASIEWLEDLKISENPAPYDRAYDLIAQFHAQDGARIELLVECKAEPRPSQFPAVAVKREFEKGHTKRARAWVFAAPHLSPRMREVCESHGWSWFDLAGNCRISIPGVIHLERTGNPPVHSRPKPTANLGTPEAGRVIRALLAPENAQLSWTQRDLQRENGADVSLGLVNKVVRYLREESFIEERQNEGFSVRDPLKLLFVWRDAYRFSAHHRRNYFTLLNGWALVDALAKLHGQSGGYVLYAAFSAAAIQAPHVRQPKTWLYVSQPLLSKFENLIEAKEVESGENIVVLVPNDGGVFAFSDGGLIEDHRLTCTNVVQTYVDLWHCGGRGREAAEAVLEQRLKPAWKAGGLLT